MRRNGERRVCLDDLSDRLSWHRFALHSIAIATVAVRDPINSVGVPNPADIESRFMGERSPYLTVACHHISRRFRLPAASVYSGGKWNMRMSELIPKYLDKLSLILLVFASLYRATKPER
jgi:hypothetical protein